ncbi:Permeases of the major facilitator superfamily [Marinobacterium lacunae]|uniref:Permeases of the major facilitator superfamily n=1 Tax=Marinobacterium lacunae TaxID=1232683 RepID=A0A081FX37_9GAMM|nr:MFS transporter [Marinobacterium lacunae]KEA63092.1 Permeases of the major facilitator superfamily [Marinobacterium lacunae]
MTTLNSLSGKAALSVGHMAGMIDMAALPLWIGVLMQHYRLQSAQAGLTVTVFLAAVVFASMVLAPKFNRLPHRFIAAGGFAVAALCFFAASRQAVSADSFQIFLILNAVAGVGAGSALSVTHGCIGRTDNPHRLFGIVNIALGMLAIAMYATLPEMIGKIGGQTLFHAFAIVMGCGALVSLLFFPQVDDQAGSADRDAERRREPIPRAAWMINGVVVCLTLSQATIFSYVERIGMARDFGEDRIQMILVLMGFINLAPGVLAALLQKRLSPIAVGIAGPLLQALFALTLTSAVDFPFYAVPTALYVTLVIFTHTFLFGLVSKVDPSGRAVAATPAMMMFGSCLGPLLGGVIVSGGGYQGLGWAVAVIAGIAVGLMLCVRRDLAKNSDTPVLAGA